MSDAIRLLAQLQRFAQPIFDLIPELEEAGSVSAAVAKKQRQLTAIEGRVAEQSDALEKLHTTAAGLQYEITDARTQLEASAKQRAQDAARIVKDALEEAVRIKAKAEEAAHDIKARANADAKKIADEGRLTKQALDEEVNEAQHQLTMVEDKLTQAQKRLDDVRSALDSIRKGA
jgi:predicted  nucleic acid-binding Zn-ribbon protein